MISPKIKLIQYAGTNGILTLSPPCAKVHMALQFKGLEYETYNCKSPKDVKRFNARGRLPSLQVDGEVFVDSSDILTELDRIQPEPPLLPKDPKLRAQCLLLEDWVDEVLYFYGVYLRWVDIQGFAWLKQAVFGTLPAPLRLIVAPIVRRQVKSRLDGQGTGLKPLEVVQRELAERLQLLSDFLGEQTYFCGQAISRADLSLAASLDQTQILGLPPVLQIDLARWPNLQNWLQRVHGAVPAAAIKETGPF
ncbi:MAG: glutathione S-transferase family protein [Planctomycetes bacterium]|nr:glutathione S-transferase family protein [Planctomycetota bacterium]